MRLLALPAFSEVSRHLRETNEPSRGVTHRRDHYVRPKSRAVAADAPALDIHPTFVARSPEEHPGYSALDIGGLENYRVRLPDDLVAFVAFDLLGARVPRRDDSFRVEHEDRVVADGFDEETEVKRLLLALGEIGHGNLGTSRWLPFALRRASRRGPRGSFK